MHLLSNGTPRYAVKFSHLQIPIDEDATISSSTPPSILEKAGVNISIVHGILPPPAIKQMRADHTSMPLPDCAEGLPFFAAGLSLVIHPRNPHALTVHANYRYFEITEPKTMNQTITTRFWLGGSVVDLTGHLRIFMMKMQSIFTRRSSPLLVSTAITVFLAWVVVCQYHCYFLRWII
jgi:coproporphyrinogen III oxidase